MLKTAWDVLNAAIDYARIDTRYFNLIKHIYRKSKLEVPLGTRPQQVYQIEKVRQKDTLSLMALENAKKVIIIKRGTRLNHLRFLWPSIEDHTTIRLGKPKSNC